MQQQPLDFTQGGLTYGKTTIQTGASRFHTSEKIVKIGTDFDADLFAQTLEDANVDSITCFAKCHHGMLYYDTKFAEARHPGL